MACCVLVLRWRCVEFKNSLCPCVEFRHPEPYQSHVRERLLELGGWNLIKV